ncbi:putative exonuclease RdgC [Vitreoscilla sp. C1]|uniref:recombination-associated protein RdgC n=1 Tax=Vitreoscilla sp. (strain C1) TaxID=96942 RepID=UPI000CDC4100|nr:recombination-associated protein RdgC [Vitreoscilla sp. C1]AUZ05336.1 putative exonuclease RdgC [Vitreoscilla sp. C1]
MWIKQLSIFVLPNPICIDSETLANAVFKPCPSLSWSSSGFHQAMPFSDSLVFDAAQSRKICLRTDTKILPASVIRDALNAKVIETQQSEERKIGRKERLELKEQITDSLLAKAFVKSTHQCAYFIDGLILVDSANSNKAENLITELRQALGGLAAVLPKTAHAPSQIMTNWLLAGEAVGNFELDSDCELVSVGEKAAIIKAKRQDLTAEEIRHHLESGKICTQLGLVWNEQIRFVLNDDLSLSRIQYLDMLQEEAANEGDDLENLMTATQIIMTQNLSLLIHELVECLGGFLF